MGSTGKLYLPVLPLSGRSSYYYVLKPISASDPASAQLFLMTLPVLPEVPGRRMVKGLLRQSGYQEYYYRAHAGRVRTTRGPQADHFLLLWRI